jgi:hypothetical protein
VFSYVWRSGSIQDLLGYPCVNDLPGAKRICERHSEVTTGRWAADVRQRVRLEHGHGNRY